MRFQEIILRPLALGPLPEVGLGLLLALFRTFGFHLRFFHTARVCLVHFRTSTLRKVKYFMYLLYFTLCFDRYSILFLPSISLSPYFAKCDISASFTPH